MTTTVSSASDATATGIRVELVIADPNGCPVAAASGETGGRACRVRRSSNAAVDEPFVGEFELQDAARDALDAVDDDGLAADCERVFATDTGDVYRFGEARTMPCVCQVVEAHGIPITDVHATDGQLHVTFHAADVDSVRDVVRALREHDDGVAVRRLRQSTGTASDDIAVVDLGSLTDRQREVVATAWRAGYFASPREANASEVAAALGISATTFAEHLAIAQRKLLPDVLDG